MFLQEMSAVWIAGTLTVFVSVKNAARIIRNPVSLCVINTVAKYMVRESNSIKFDMKMRTEGSQA